MAKIIVVDDEPVIRALVDEILTGAGHLVRTADGGRAFRNSARRETPDLVVLDVTMPGEDGLSLARWAREHLGCGVVMLTAMDTVMDRVIGLEVGADDYLAKPFAPAELTARVDAVLRRRLPGANSTAQDGTVAVGRFRFDLAGARLLGPDGLEHRLAPMECQLLKAFVDHPRKVLSRDELLDLAPPRGDEPFDRSIDNRVTRLRRKLETDQAKPDLIKTVRGGGYIFVPEVG